MLKIRLFVIQTKCASFPIYTTNMTTDSEKLTLFFCLVVHNFMIEVPTTFSALVQQINHNEANVEIILKTRL